MLNGQNSGRRRIVAFLAWTTDAVGNPLGSASPPHLAKATLLQFSARRPVLKVIDRVHGRAATARNLLARLVAKDANQNRHRDAGKDTDAKDSNHGQIAATVLVAAFGRVGGPTCVQRVRRRDAAQVAQPGNEGGGSSNAHLAVSSLENLVGPGHADGHGGAETEADHEKATVSGPWVVKGERHGQKAGDLDKHGAGKENGAQSVEAIRDWGDEQNGTEIHLSTDPVSIRVLSYPPYTDRKATYNPNRRKQ